MRIVLAALVVAMAAALGGCASVTRGWSEQVQFDSEPSGAEMRSVIENACDEACTAENAHASGRDSPVYGTVEKGPPRPGPACITPCTATVARRDVLIATFTKAGHEPQTLKIDTQVAGAGAVGLAGNVIIGGGIGAVIDVGSGAMLEHHPNPAKVTLRALPAATPKPTPPRRRERPTS